MYKVWNILMNFLSRISWYLNVLFYFRCAKLSYKTAIHERLVHYDYIRILFIQMWIKSKTGSGSGSKLFLNPLKQFVYNC